MRDGIGEVLNLRLLAREAGRGALTFSKDMAFADIDLDVLYTFVGSREEQNTLDIALASEYPIVNHLLSVIGEVVHTVGTGASMAETHQTKARSGLRSEAEETIDATAATVPSP